MLHAQLQPLQSILQLFYDRFDIYNIKSETEATIIVRLVFKAIPLFVLLTLLINIIVWKYQRNRIDITNACTILSCAEWEQTTKKKTHTHRKGPDTDRYKSQFSAFWTKAQSLFLTCVHLIRRCVRLVCAMDKHEWKQLLKPKIQVAC